MKHKLGKSWEEFGYCVFHGRYFHGQGSSVCPVCDLLEWRQAHLARVKRESVVRETDRQKA
jgi:hypothetical protein